MFLSVPGSVLETSVGEDANSALLLNLLSGTEYSVQVTALYPSGQSEPLLATGKTCKLADLLVFPVWRDSVSFPRITPCWGSLTLAGESRQVETSHVRATGIGLSKLGKRGEKQKKLVNKWWM